MIVLVVLIIFSYGPHSNVRGGRQTVPLGEGVMASLFWTGKDSKKGRKRSKKLLHSHFLNSSTRWTLWNTCYLLFWEIFWNYFRKLCKWFLSEGKAKYKQAGSPEGRNKFELKHYNIIHAPTDTSKHFIDIFETLTDGSNKTANGRNKRPGYSRKFNMADRNGWSFCSLVCERLLAFFHPWKRVSFLYFDWSGLHFLAV